MYFKTEKIFTFWTLEIKKHKKYVDMFFVIISNIVIILVITTKKRLSRIQASIFSLIQTVIF